MHPYINIAVSAARRAGTIITRHLEKLDSLEIYEKGVNDFVTLVDQAAEEVILDTIYKAYPHHGILAEESGFHEGNEYTWIIDPLDGTYNFTHGFPQFAVSIGILNKGIIEHGVVFDPVSQDLYTATKGAGAQLNNRRIRVSQRDQLKSSLIGISFPFKGRTPISKEQWNRHADAAHALLFEHLVDTRKVGSAALNLAYVASGKLDGFYECGLKEWDIAAGMLLVREAGGYVTDFNNQALSLDNGTVVAGTPKIHANLLKLIEEYQLQ